MVRIIGKAAFTRDMVETLDTYFDAYARTGIVEVELSDRGLWLVNPYMPARQFLGLARTDDDPDESLSHDDLTNDRDNPNA